VANGRVDLLFIAPEQAGASANVAASRSGRTECRTPDVNEQNPQALGFYLHEGFEIIGRSATDGRHSLTRCCMQRVRTP
jgi:putative acetyltransferase